MDQEQRHLEDPQRPAERGLDAGPPAAQNADGDHLVIDGPEPAGADDVRADGRIYDAALTATETSSPEQPAAGAHRRRRRALPLFLFLATCVSTFFVGTTLWCPQSYLFMSWQEANFMPLRLAVVGHWQQGLIYMGCVLAILLTHEMGHFLATLRYRIPASYPFFLPMPVNPLGTMGAVIGMDGLRADRRQLFDIGIAGPLAGLLVAIPIMWLGIQRLDFTQPVAGPFRLDVPFFIRMLLDANPPTGYTPGQLVAQSQLNAYFMAGWVGLFVTGLNMMPVSQLDGGHVTYTMFGKTAHWIARIFMLVTVVGMVFDIVSRLLWLMVLLTLLIGTDHPKTSDDNVKLGWGRMVLGTLSLSIPFLCFAPKFILFPPY